MSDDVSKDPAFRDQYTGGVGEPDPEFEAALGGYSAPIAIMRPQSSVLRADARWASVQVVKLR